MRIFLLTNLNYYHDAYSVVVTASTEAQAKELAAEEFHDPALAKSMDCQEIGTAITSRSGVVLSKHVRDAA